VRIGFVFLGFLEPEVFNGCVTRDEIKQNMHTAFLGFSKEPFEVLIGTISGGNPVIISHIIAGILEWRYKTGVYPQSIDSQALEIIQFFNNPGDIPNAIIIRIVEGLGVDLIEDGFVKPGR